MISPPDALGPATGVTPSLATPYRDMEEYCFQSKDDEVSGIKDIEVIAAVFAHIPATQFCPIGVVAFVSFVESILKGFNKEVLA